MEPSELSEDEGPRRFVNKSASRIARFLMVYDITNDHQLVVFLFSCPYNDKERTGTIKERILDVLETFSFQNMG